jgi:glycosyltransferase involved in cell wall biosynthesis
MSGLRSLRPLAARAYLGGCARLARLRLRGGAAERSLERVCIVAALGRHNGVATGAKLQYGMLRSLGIDAELVDATAALRNPLFRAPHRPGTAYVLHSGGPQVSSLVSAVLPHAAAAWRIAYWAWELPDPPLDWDGYDSLVHEVWTPSEFARASISQLTRLPVSVVPHVVPAQGMRRRDWTQPFTVLAFGDTRSSLTRKNLTGAIDAFRSAFGDAPRARLILKISGSGDAADTVQDLVATAPNVVVLREFLEADELAGLYRSADALLSMHRAEGFGLPLLEAMAHGVPVVATGWSGNLEFMDRSNGILVPYRLVPVEDAAGIYGGSVWAEPSTNVAAMALRRLAEDEDYYERKSAAAHAAVARTMPPSFLVAPARSAACDGQGEEAFLGNVAG